MVDYIAVLAVGIVLFIGLIPLMFKRFRGDDFLVSYIDSRDGRLLTQEEFKTIYNKRGEKYGRTNSTWVST
jgi:hypothetical protein